MSADRELRRRGPPAGPPRPRRRLELELLAGLRDAHAGAAARGALLHRAEAALADPGLRTIVGWMAAEAEEQGRRIAHVFALLEERLAIRGDRAPAPPALPALPRGTLADAALRALLLREARRATVEATALRLMAHAAGLHLVARLMDLTAEELRRAAGELASAAVARRLH